MANLNKKTLVDAIVTKNPELTKKNAGEIVDLIFDEIIIAVKNGKKVDITGFGKFVLKERKARVGINPSTKETINIPAMKAPAFKAAKGFKDIVK